MRRRHRLPPLPQRQLRGDFGTERGDVVVRKLVFRVAVDDGESKIILVAVFEGNRFDQGRDGFDGIHDWA